MTAGRWRSAGPHRMMLARNRPTTPHPVPSMRLRPVLAAGLIAALPLTGTAQAARDSVISVSVTRSARIAPDRATFMVTLEGAAESAGDAVSRAEAKRRAVADALRALGDKVTSEAAIALAVSPTPNMGGFPQSNLPATFTARSVIRVHVHAIDQLAAVQAAVLDAGGASVPSLTFESSSADAVRRDRVAEAITAARREAESIATALGGRLGTLVEVTTTGGPATPQPSFLNLDGRFGVQGQAPEVLVTAVVTLRFRLLR